MVNTLDYYNENAKTFIDRTRYLEFTDPQDLFLGYMKHGARILDFGCGSGRDTKYFLNKGYQVDAIDGSEEFAKLASEYTGIAVKHMLFQELDAEDIYDGIWACASILHLRKDELEDVFVRMAKALVSNGIIYASFKYGTDERERNGRYFTDMTEDKMEGLLDKIGKLKVLDMRVTTDVRPGRDDEKWLNIIIRKNI